MFVDREGENSGGEKHKKVDEWTMVTDFALMLLDLHV